MVEISRNAVEDKTRREDKSGKRDGDGRGGDILRTGKDKHFKEPTGGFPQKISREVTPLMAKEWGEDMHLYAKRCSSLDSLASGAQSRPGAQSQRIRTHGQ